MTLAAKLALYIVSIKITSQKKWHEMRGTPNPRH